MPVEQPIPEGPARIELGPITESELRTPGAVKLLYGELADLKAAHAALVADLQLERQRNETLTFRAHSSETECSVLRARLGYARHRDMVVRLIELAILGVLAFAIDFAKSGSWPSFGAASVLAIILVVAIILIQRGDRPKENG